MKQLVISVIGKDRSGIVDQLSAIILQHHGNWLASSLTELAGQFAGILHIEVPPEHMAALSHELLHQPGLLVNIAEGEDAAAQQCKQVAITVTANDRNGIVQEVTQALSKLGVSLSKIQTHVASAPNWGGLIFSANLLVPCDSEQQLNTIQETLESLADDLMVDIEQD
ncbi:glycine cleavage system protein R [Agarivorans sp.]|uniref:glycine cleavage system protein R n=1 Tax=Agarivorans sp. TaxID=1872412 RepID=UPI003D05C73C